MCLMRILIAGVGNVLRGDDGFGVEVARRLSAGNSLSGEVEIFEAGIAGIALVQELMGGYDALIVADAVDRGGAPGTVHLFEPEVPDPETFSAAELHRSLADAHYTDPSKALLLARALKVLPPKVFVVGCQPESYDELGAGLSPAVEAAVQAAVRQIESLVESLGRREKPQA
jgi:hydrogenase maturation protease